jgi:pimeloyl-ACP methyl ester carboxylesterase
MTVQELSFYSDGLRLGARLHVSPAGSKGPVLVVCSGLHGLKEWVPSRWAPAALSAGFHVFAFDYRGFGTSEGQRGRILPEEEVRDTVHAFDFLKGLAEVDPERMAVLGWGLGAGVAVCAAVRDPDVAAVCSANGAGDYGRTVRDATPYPQLLRWQDQIREDRLERARTGVSRKVDYRAITNPGADVGFQLHPQFQKDIRSLGQEPIQEFTLESCEAYVEFRPEEVVGRLASRPFLIVHGERNHYMPVSEAHRLHEAAGPGRELRIYKRQAHLEMISSDNPISAEFMRDTVGWLFQAVTRSPSERQWYRSSSSGP